MKFGKLENIDNVDFSLPPEFQENSKAITYYPGNSKLYVGATGWSMPDWKGVIYPEKAKSKDFLIYYSKQFNTIELNSTHYRLPPAETINNWVNSTPSDFKFCPKFWQNISHRKDLGLQSGALDKFIDGMLSFDNKLGPCFLQLPPYFGIERINLLHNLLSRIPENFDIAVEARHESFFEDESFFALLNEKGAIAVITDVAGRRDILHSRITTNKAFIRWVGNGLHPSDYTRLEEWKSRLNLWKEYGISEVYFFPHQPDNILTPQISFYFYEMMKASSGYRGRAPILKPKNNQLKLF